MCLISARCKKVGQESIHKSKQHIVETDAPMFRADAQKTCFCFRISRNFNVLFLYSRVGPAVLGDLAVECAGLWRLPPGRLLPAALEVSRVLAGAPVLKRAAVVGHCSGFPNRTHILKNLKWHPHECLGTVPAPTPRPPVTRRRSPPWGGCPGTSWPLRRSTSLSSHRHIVSPLFTTV